MTLIRRAYGHARYHRKATKVHRRIVVNRGLMHEALRQPVCKNEVSIMLNALYMAKYQRWMSIYANANTMTNPVERQLKEHVDAERQFLIHHMPISDAQSFQLSYVSFIHTPVVIGEVSTHDSKILIRPWMQRVSYLFDRNNATLAQGLYDAVIVNDMNTPTASPIRALFRYKDCRIYIRSSHRAKKDLPRIVERLQSTHCPSKISIIYPTSIPEK